MNNKELITELSQRTGNSQHNTQKMVMTVLENLLAKVVKQNAVQVPAFGTFEVKKRVERCIVNPGNGKKMLIPPKLVMNFRPVTAWKEHMQKGGAGDEQD